MDFSKTDKNCLPMSHYWIILQAGTTDIVVTVWEKTLKEFLFLDWLLPTLFCIQGLFLLKDVVFLLQILFCYSRHEERMRCWSPMGFQTAGEVILSFGNSNKTISKLPFENSNKIIFVIFFWKQSHFFKTDIKPFPNYLLKTVIKLFL